MEVSPSTDHSVKRNYYGWPLVMPPGAGPLVAEERRNHQKVWWYSKEAEAYGRASGIGKYLEDANNLIPWAAAQAAVGVLLDQSARSEIVALINEFEKDPWGRGGKDRLKSAVDKARKTAGSEVASTAGTEFHGYTELIDMGKRPSFIQEEFKPLVEGYERATADIEWLDAEPFVVNDTLKVAGSIDRVARIPESWDHPLAGKVAVVDLKGLPLDTKIPTPTGWSTMDELRVGDEVFGSNGKPCVVTAKSAVKRIGTFVVGFDDGSEVVCDSEHLWLTEGHHTTAVRSVTEIRDTLKHRGQCQHKVPVAEPLETEQADLPLPPYLLGAWLGDGHARSGCITKEDDLFDVLRADGVELGIRQNYNDPDKSNIATHSVIGMTQYLRDMNLLHNKHIPMMYLRASREQRTLLLQGLFDTDGCWNIARNEATFSSTDEVLARQVHELLCTLGQRPYMYSCERKGFGLTVIAHDVKFTPRNIEPFRLPRKLNAMREGMKHKSLKVTRRRLIKSVTPGPDVETVCIAVDSPDSTFLCTEKFIPTHNTGRHDPSYPLKPTVQVAAYANSVRYNQETGVRSPLHDDISTDWGVLMHYPIMTENPKVQFYPLDLRFGMQAAVVAQWVRDLRKLKALEAVK